MRRKNAQKNEDGLAERSKFSTSTTTLWRIFLHKNDFQIMIFLADMAF